MLRISGCGQTGPYEDRPGFGVVAEAVGGLRHLPAEPDRSALPGIAPTNAYLCADGWVLVAGNGDSIFKRLMKTVGCDDLGHDPQLATNAGRVVRVAEIDAAIGVWTAPQRVIDVLEALNAAAVPAGRIYTAKDSAEHPHYRARGMIQQVITAEGLSVEVPGIVPKLSLTPGAIRRRAPTLDEDRAEVLGEQSEGPKRAPS